MVNGLYAREKCLQGTTNQYILRSYDFLECESAGFREGALITLTTPDEDELPLPNRQLLGLHNAICKVAEACGEELGDYYSDNDSDLDR
jgi:hypothetical protein